jgi:hypothetical protein
MSASSADRKRAGMESDDDEVPYVPDDFEGASSRVHDVLEMPRHKHTCRVCAATFPFWDHFAYFDKSGKPALQYDSVLNQVHKTVTGEGFTNLAKESCDVVLTCVLCAEKATQENYTVRTVEGFTVTSAWKTLARRTKPNMKLPAKKLKNAMKTMGDRINRDGGDSEGHHVDIEEVYTMTKSKLARQATDWVCELALNLSILYGCVKCNLYPLRSSHWWRCNSAINSQDGTVTGGHWRCAGCLARYSGGDAHTKRLLAIGDEREYNLFHIGSTTPLVEAKIRFLQLCQIVTVLDGMQVTKEALLECIRKLNERTERRLSLFKEVVTMRAKDPSEMNVKIFCSDARLYLKDPGQEFKALDLMCETIEELSEEDQNNELDFAFGLTNWQEKYPKEPSLRKVFRGLEVSKSTAESRAALLDTLSKL